MTTITNNYENNTETYTSNGIKEDILSYLTRKQKEGDFFSKEDFHNSILRTEDIYIILNMKNMTSWNAYNGYSKMMV